MGRANCSPVSASGRIGDARWNLRTAKDYAAIWLNVTVQRYIVHALGDISAFADAEGVEPRFQNVLQYPEELT